MTKATLSCTILGATVLAGAASLAMAERPTNAPLLEVAELIHGGPGCPQGTLRYAWSPDGQRLALGFDAYAAGVEPGGSIDRVSCNIAVPVSMPPGVRMSLSRLRVYGDADIPQDGRGSFHAEYFFAGATGPILAADFPAGFADDFVLTSDTPVRSGCGDDVTLRVNSSALARQPSTQSTAAVVDVGFMTLLFEMERCDF